MFSVVIPAYNHQSYIAPAILSSVGSSLVSEVLVVDDGSRDTTALIISKLSEKFDKIKNLTEDPPANRGAHYRLNQLVRQASNEWVAVLNSDDIFAPGRFSGLEHRARCDQADLFFGSITIIDRDERYLGAKLPLRDLQYPWPVGFDATAFARKEDWLPLLLNQNFVATTSNLVFRKSLFEKIGGFRDFRYVHDWDFVLRAAALGRMVYAPEMVTYYRIHPQNTIKEDQIETRHEVVRLFADFLNDFEQYRGASVRLHGPPGRQHAVELALRGNPHLRTAARALAVILPATFGTENRGKLSTEFPEVEWVDSFREVPADIPYVYSPSSVETILSPNDLRNCLLSLSVLDSDFVIVSKSHSDFPKLGVAIRRDHMIAAAGKATTLLQSGPVREPVAGRVVRLLPGDVPPRDIEDLFPATPHDFRDGALYLDGAEIVEPRIRFDGYPEVLCVPPKDKPTIFILPAFFAVGGVERATLETIKALHHRYRFVMICTERLAVHQGSLHSEVLPYLHGCYELPEILPAAGFIAALRLLKHAYRPDLVWICNGSNWQCENARQLRKTFSDIPIIDNQAYDHEVGWIARFDDPGVCTADRFVAINRKIRRTMEERFAIPPSKIDLIYSGSDMSRLRYRKVTAEIRAEHRRRFGLDPTKPLFGMIGRLTVQKRPLDLVALAQRMGTAVQFVWVGLGELELEVKAAMQRVPNATLVPAQSDLRPVYEMLDGMVITSEFEGLPIVLLEALAMGLPVLSTDVGGIREVLDRYKSGMTFGPPGDVGELERAFKAFRRALPELSRAAGRHAKQVAEDFSAARMAREYEASFRQAIEDFKPASLTIEERVHRPVLAFATTAPS